MAAVLYTKRHAIAATIAGLCPKWKYVTHSESVLPSVLQSRKIVLH